MSVIVRKSVTNRGLTEKETLKSKGENLPCA